MTMKIACKASNTHIPLFNLTFDHADEPQEVADEIGEELLKMGLFYKFGIKKVIKEENYGSSFSNFTIEEVENNDH